MSHFPILSLLSFLSLLTFSSARTITLALSPAIPPPHIDPWQKLRYLATTSITRAHYLRNPTTAIRTPLFPRSYGAYSILLNFGTPPQTLPFLMDTGSSLVWSPCTNRYVCDSCNFAGVNYIPTFQPRLSFSSRILSCENPICTSLFPTYPCNCSTNNRTSCTERCPPYSFEYGSGSTAGILLSETLSLPGERFRNFALGCSLESTSQPSGIAGFGRGAESLPLQMGVKKFSYCLVSHRFDDTLINSLLVLETGGDSGSTTVGGGTISYTPFMKNPVNSNPAFLEYYYVPLQKITVGGVDINAPDKYLLPDSSGNGGTIIDSGTTFTFMENKVFDLLAQEFEQQVGQNYSRALQAENSTGFGPCYNVASPGSINLPQLTFHYKGGARMVLPLADYFSFFSRSVICMTITTDDGENTEVGPGPSIILGNYQQQNFYIEYDLENERLGFRRQTCG